MKASEKNREKEQAMTEKRMLIVDSELLEKIDQNRGDMSRTEFLKFLIDSHTEAKEVMPDKKYLEKAEFEEFTREMKELLRRFLDFFMSYGMQNNGESGEPDFNELSQRLQSLSGGQLRNKTGK